MVPERYGEFFVGWLSFRLHDYDEILGLRGMKLSNQIMRSIASAPTLPDWAEGWVRRAQLHRRRHSEVGIVPGNRDRRPVASVNASRLPPLAFGRPIGQVPVLAGLAVAGNASSRR
jgi:hypothetical protein